MRKIEERRIKDRERMMIDSDTTSEEDICQEMSRMTLDKMAAPRDYYYSNTSTVQSRVCGTIHSDDPFLGACSLYPDLGPRFIPDLRHC